MITDNNKKSHLLFIFVIIVGFLIACNKNPSNDNDTGSNLPVIDPANQFSLPDDCIFSDFQSELEVIDPDGDSIEVSVNIGDVVMADFYIDSIGVSHWVGYIDFNMENFCGQVYEDNFVVTAVDENDSSSSLSFGLLTIVGRVTVSMADTVYIWPGFEEWMPVYLDAPECFCLDAFELTVVFDPTVLTITDIERGVAIADGEYWNCNINILGPGSIKLVFINDLANQTPVEPICNINPEVPIFRLKFFLNPEQNYPVNFYVPICFYEGDNNNQFNAVTTDEDSGHVWIKDGCDDQPDSAGSSTLLLTLDNGNIKVLNIEFILGDINWNGVPWEIGDAVLAFNAKINCGYPMTERQRQAGDIDGDDKSITLTDLLYLYGVVAGIMDSISLTPPHVFPCNPLSDTLIIESVEAVPGETLYLPVTLITHDTLIGLEMYIVSDEKFIVLDSILFEDSLGLNQVTCHQYPFLFGANGSLDGSSNPIYPGTYHIGDLIAHVNSEIKTPLTVTIEFSSLPDSILFTGLVNPTFFEPVMVNATIQIISDD